MAGRIRQEDLEVVRERTDLVKLVSSYLSLKKAGHDSMVGLCPFHQEKTPSLSVSPAKQLYYCFGCGAGGDAIRFLREVEHLTFGEAVERLAKEAGVTLRYEGDSAAERRAADRKAALQRANKEAAGLYQRMLLEGGEAAEARSYLEQRGIDRAAAEEFEIGFAPVHPDYLLRRMSQRFGPDVMVEAGLAGKDAGGGVRDRFRGRLTFPIQDLTGRHVGFGARILPSDPRASEQAKYLNTAETPIYRKGELLYNLHRARQSIARSGEAFVVEGYTDVIAMWQTGIQSAVATCGTALGEGHFRLLSRFAGRVVLAFDSDEAGARAAERAHRIHDQFPVQAFVMVLPDGLDPADFVRRHGAEGLQEAAGSARPLVEFMITRAVAAHDRSTVEGQSAAVAAGLPIIGGLSDPVRRREYAHLLAEQAGVAESSVLLALEQSLAGRPVGVQSAVKRGGVQERVEREMLKLLARDTQTWRSFSPRLSEDHFRAPRNRKLYGVLARANGDSTSIVATTDDDDLVSQVSALAIEPLDGDATQDYADGVLARLEEFALKRRSDELRAQLQKLNPTVDESYDSLFQQLVTIDGQLRRLRGGRHHDAPVAS